jgi:hypothetical protein
MYEKFDETKVVIRRTYMTSSQYTKGVISEAVLCNVNLFSCKCLNSDCQPCHRYQPLTLNNIEHKKSTTYGVKNLVSGLGYSNCINGFIEMLIFHIVSSDNNYITSVFHWNVTIWLAMKWSHHYKRDVLHSNKTQTSMCLHDDVRCKQSMA